MQFIRFVSLLRLAVLAVLCGQVGVMAQFGAKAPSAPSISAAAARVFGDNSAFSADMEMSTKEDGQDIVMPGKMAFDGGRSRFEMDMTEVKGARIKESDARQMKQMGMDKMISIARPDKKTTYQVWPGFKAYTETPLVEGDGDGGAKDYKMEVSGLGKETVDGHACEKNKVVVTGPKGEKHEFLVWNATDLKGFPVQMVMAAEGRPVRMSYKNVQLSKPAAELFDPPAGFKRYDSMQDMMMTEMMKRENAGDGAAPESGGDESDKKKSRNLLKKRLLPF